MKTNIIEIDNKSFVKNVETQAQPWKCDNHLIPPCFAIW
jgi:hypothetical protein